MRRFSDSRFPLEGEIPKVQHYWIMLYDKKGHGSKIIRNAITGEWRMEDNQEIDISKFETWGAVPRFYIVNQLEDGTHTEYHRFPGDDYRSAISYNAFFHYWKKARNFDGRYLYYAKPEWEFFELRRSQFKIFHEMGIELPKNELWAMFDPPMREHNSIWDFYDHIGYDRKRKRFTK